MALIVFYEKPGCRNNARQKAWLLASGHTLDVRSLLTEPWTADRLAPFFGDEPVAGWFNRAAPRVKAGEVDPLAMTAERALAAMVADPLLIRRPLMQVSEERRCGFEPEAVRAWIGLTDEDKGDVETCPALQADPAHHCPDPTD